MTTRYGGAVLVKHINLKEIPMRILPSFLVFGLAFSLVGCSGSDADYVRLSGDYGKDRIILGVQGAPEGTVCQVATPDGVLKNNDLANSIEIPTKFRNSPLSCRLPNGSVKKLKVLATIPVGTKRSAAVTVHLPTGEGHSTYGNAQGQLVQPQWNANEL